MKTFIDGKKSYILGIIMVLIGLAEFASIDVIEAVTQGNSFNYIAAGFAVITGKSAIAKIER